MSWRNPDPLTNADQLLPKHILLHAHLLPKEEIEAEVTRILSERGKPPTHQEVTSLSGQIIATTMTDPSVVTSTWAPVFGHFGYS